MISRYTANRRTASRAPPTLRLSERSFNPHPHNEDETFYILEGEVTMFVGDERIDLAAGDLLVRPARRPPTPTSSAPSADGCS